ncbi:hypothetical protein ACFS32_08425 [Novosphingobium pokkalii]|uniref:hypothetical protein n=1 Tax=Novosphingobium pokkalii TaxID=1770194 RepID=UPI0036399146
MATLSRHQLQVANLRWHVRPLIVQAIDDGQWSGKQIVDRQVVEACDLNHHILLASVWTPDMRVGGDAAAIAEMMRTLVLSHEAT